MKNLTLLTLALAVSASAAEYRFTMKPETTQVNWTLGDVLHTVHGTFKLLSGEIVFDPANGKASGDVVVDATSGNSGSGARDGRMHKNVLESAKYPEISFSPDRMEGKVELAGPSNVSLHGVFKIHGASHEISVPVQVNAHDGKMEAHIKFAVPFVEWGMKDPSTLFLKVNKSVDIDLGATGNLLSTTGNLANGSR
jgi:polyisoprenoid-binding protein YceI